MKHREQTRLVTFSRTEIFTAAEVQNGEMRRRNQCHIFTTQWPTVHLELPHLPFMDDSATEMGDMFK